MLTPTLTQSPLDAAQAMEIAVEASERCAPQAAVAFHLVAAVCAPALMAATSMVTPTGAPT